MESFDRRETILDFVINRILRANAVITYNKLC